VKATIALSSSTLPVGEATRVSLVMHFGADAAEHGATASRRHLNLGLVLDRSGSMAGAPLKQAIRAAEALVDELRGDDRVSVVIYDDTAETIVAPELVATDKDRIKGLLGKVRAGGCTNLSGGWLEGCKHVQKHAAREQVSRVLLLTDGQANMGIKDPGVLIETARKKAAEGVHTTTLGFGSGFNEDLLIGMARASEGNFYFIESPEDVAQVFKIELEGLASVVGQNLVVSVRPGESVEHGWVLNDYRTEEREKEIDVIVGDVYAVEDRLLVLELLVRPPAEGTIDVAQVSYTFQSVVGGAIQEIKGSMSVTATAAGAATAAAAAPDIAAVSDASRIQAARSKDEAVKLADKGDLAAAAQKLRAMAKELQSGPLAGQFEFAEEVDQLQHFAERLEKRAYDGGVRKELRDQSYQGSTRVRGDLAQRGTTGGTASGLPVVQSAGEGVVLRCERQGGKLRVHVTSDGYDTHKNVQFPRAAREEGVTYVVDKVVPSADGVFYRVEGAIKRLLRPGEQVKPARAAGSSAAAAPAKPSKTPATAADLPTTTEVGTGVIIQCVAEGSKLRARVVSDGYDPNWNIRFPRSIRELGVLYVVDQVSTVSGGGQYAATGEIKRLVQ
jgi:Ca-activated chloride channel family protein